MKESDLHEDADHNIKEDEDDIHVYSDDDEDEEYWDDDEDYDEDGNLIQDAPATNSIMMLIQTHSWKRKVT